MKKTDEMVEALVHYYEAAGFEDIYEKKLKLLSEEEIIELYNLSLGTTGKGSL